ncbi:hypothetical protein AUC69_09765 [Methyloceanibacter superfactus]|jgi:hypothetical protein|uniref:Uncharacterized protein n=1 Tax=Methyloceanibacter superfactus TaxID=1774969 RepID=A0A1E3VXD3_9HYPH|nr:hypothetical protein [Methyloceanibacter superfactus]ODR98197.1 hypothetical protein AUC69_09765 [Methyloceanibacter superfactus]
MRSLNERIDAMYRRDRLSAWTFVAVLWVVILFVLFMVWQVTPDPAIRLVLAVAAGAVLLFNTASIGAMVKHYREDKEFIYGLDIRHLDAARELRAEASKQSAQEA